MSALKDTLAKLTTDDTLPQLQKTGEFLKFLNATPPDEWLDADRDGKYKTMPIGRVEWLLTNIFQEWYVEVLKTETMFNSLVVTVRVYYKDPVDQKLRHQDGVGAAPAKTKKGAAASDMSAITNEAVQTGLPAAKSFAIKDACDHIGRIFGRDINREGALGYTNPYEEDKDEATIQAFKDAETAEQIDNILSNLSPESKRAYVQVAKNRLQEIRSAA